MATGRKHMILGVVSLAAFFVVLVIMFLPIFSGKNAFQAADDFFNSIAKGSSNYFETVKGLIKEEKLSDISVEVSKKADMGNNFETVLRKAGASTEAQGDKLKIKGNYSELLGKIVKDCEDGYYENTSELEKRYGMNPRIVLYTWWNLLKEMEKEFKLKKQFKEAKIANEVVAKAVEVSYNFYGIKAEKASNKFVTLLLVLVFYVFYTLWYGYGILWLFDGMGLEMKAGKKKEV
jgi:hypothetical protein